MRTALPAALAALLVAASLPAQPAAEGAVVARVEFVGEPAVDPRFLREGIETRRGARLDTAALRRDETALAMALAAWGYPDAAVRASVLPAARRRVRVRFELSPGAPLRVGRVVLRGGAPEVVSAEALPIAPGDVYALPRVEAAQRRVARAYAARGHAFVRVDAPPQPVAEGRADVVLEVTPGPVARFGHTEITAEAPLRPEEARRRLPYRAGERFDPAKLEHAAERLYALPIVDSVALRTLPVEWSPEVTLTAIDVSTAPGGMYEVRGVASSASCVGAEGFVAHRHALGRPRAVSLVAGTTNLFASRLCGADDEGRLAEPGYHLRASLAEPVGRASWLLADAALLRVPVPGAYVRSGWQLRLGASREVARGVEAGVAVAPERSDPVGAGALYCALYGSCDGGPGAARLVPVEGSAAWSRPAWRAALGPPPPGPAWLHPPLPRWIPGAALAAEAGGRALGSDFDFARAVGELSLTRLAGRVQLGARLRAGVLLGAGEPLPPRLRLFGGGPRGVRGAPSNQLGPRVLVLRPDRDPATLGDTVTGDDVRSRAAGGDRVIEASLEARVWAFGRAQLAVFLDYGALRARGGGSGLLAGHRWESLLSPGVGVLALTPAGAVRVDVAYDPSPPRAAPLLQAVDGGGYRPLGTVVYDPGRGFRDRLRLQLATGLPF